VLSLQGDEWFTPNRVAYLADTFVNNQALPVVSKAQEGRPARVVTATATVSQGVLPEEVTLRPAEVVMERHIPQ